MSPLLLAITLCVFSGSISQGAVVTGADGSLANEHLRVTPLPVGDRYRGFSVTAGERLVAEVLLGPTGTITADKAQADATHHTGSLRFSGLRVSGDALRLGPAAFVVVELTDRSPWPRISFNLPVEAFNMAGWQRLVGGTLPFHFLVCSLPQATMFYQGGGLIPLPGVDPFPLMATGFMAGEWAPGWTYAPPMAGSTAGRAAIEQFAVEALVDGRVVRMAPLPMALTEYDRTAGLGPGSRPRTRPVVVGEGNIFTRRPAWRAPSLWRGLPAIRGGCGQTPVAPPG